MASACPQPQRLLDEQVLLRLPRRRDQLLVTIGFRADDHRLHRAVGEDRLHLRDELRPQLRRALLTAPRVVVPHRLHRNDVALPDGFDEAGRVDVRAADECEGGHVSP